MTLHTAKGLEEDGKSFIVLATERIKQVRSPLISLDLLRSPLIDLG